MEQERTRSVVFGGANPALGSGRRRIRLRLGMWLLVLGERFMSIQLGRTFLSAISVTVTTRTGHSSNFKRTKEAFAFAFAALLAS